MSRKGRPRSRGGNVYKRLNSKNLWVRYRDREGRIVKESSGTTDWDEAERWLRQALSLAQAVGNPTQLWKTHLAMGRLHTEAKRPDQARQAYRAAREVIDRIKASVQNPELRAGLERSTLIQHVYDLSASG